ncbi:MAG: ABC transporter permease [Alphaproteobacteria bacterium]|nr:ABC transporter permease [Alphaproteobacteria bacterium]
MSGGRWLGYAARRLAMAVPILLGVVLFTFVLMRLLPGDPAVFFASSPNPSQAELLALRAKLGLDRSLPEQLAIYVRDLARGELGQSLTTGQPVARDLLARLPASIELTVVAFLLAMAVALPLGVAAATRPNSWLDHLARVVITAGVSVPTFVTGIVLIYLFYYLLGWAPDPTGRIDVFIGQPPRVTGLLLIDSLLNRNPERFLAALKQLALPAATMALFAIAPIARMTRASMLGVLSSDFVRTARALGLPRRQVLLTYAFRNALIPVVTTLGMVLSYMLGANVLVEKVFAWPGIGSYALDAIVVSDYAPVQGFVLAVSALFVFLNLAVDLIYGLIDPRIGFER